MIGIPEQWKLFDEHWARPNQRHVAANDVEDLWRLIDAPTPQELAKVRDAGILAVTIRNATIWVTDDCITHVLGTHHHRAELLHRDELSTAADSLLAIEHRPTTRELHPDRRNEHERQEEHREEDADSEIQGALDCAFRSGEVRLI